MKSSPVAATLVLLTTLMTAPGCGTPLAVAGIVVGTGSFVGGAVTHEDCDDEPSKSAVDSLCYLNNALSGLLLGVGGLLVVGSGISLLVDQQ